MSIYLWYSKNSKDSGVFLANALNIKDHGTLLPEGFNGTVICWGAQPTDKFKWDKRNLRAILNDPREVAKLRDRKVIMDKLSHAGVNVISCIPFAPEAQYANVCNLLGATEAEGFAVCKENGVKARLVTSQADLQTAIDAGCNRAMDRKFVSENYVRVFMVAGDVVASAKKSMAADNQVFADRVSGQVGINGFPQANVSAVIKKLLDDGFVSPKKSFWAPNGVLTPAMKTRAGLVYEALKFQFVAIDFDPVTSEVINVVTTPNLLENVSIQAPITTAIKAWATKNTKTAKEILMDLVNDATNEEADSILEELRSIKNQHAGAKVG